MYEWKLYFSNTGWYTGPSLWYLYCRAPIIKCLGEGGAQAHPSRPPPPTTWWARLCTTRMTFSPRTRGNETVSGMMLTGNNSKRRQLTNRFLKTVRTSSNNAFHSITVPSRRLASSIISSSRFTKTWCYTPRTQAVRWWIHNLTTTPTQCTDTSSSHARGTRFFPRSQIRGHGVTREHATWRCRTWNAPDPNTWILVGRAGRGGARTTCYVRPYTCVRVHVCFELCRGDTDQEPLVEYGKSPAVNDKLYGNRPARNGAWDETGEKLGGSGECTQHSTLTRRQWLCCTLEILAVNL